jgi:hypothetical protein
MSPVKIKKVIFISSCLLLSSCSLLNTHQVTEISKQVKIYDDYEQVKNCQYIGELVGSEGSWYTFFFISNAELTLGSIADLKNKAADIGADSIHVEAHMGFNTSVTFLGHTYKCL